MTIYMLTLYVLTGGITLHFLIEYVDLYLD